MYLSYYNLKHKPFQISTDPGFLWLGEKHMEALATLRYGVMDNKGFLLLTGDVGTGKTTLIHALLQDLGTQVLTAFIRDPNLEPMDFYNYTAYSFGMEGEVTSKSSFLIRFEKFLNDAYRDKKKVLLIIDEAQRITQELLEEVRLLSNIEKDISKLLNIFFIGQIEFNDILLRPVNRPIRQRITVNYNIEPLTEDETEKYIWHRLAIARHEDSDDRADFHKESSGMFVQERFSSTSRPEDEIFTAAAIDEVYLFSKGYPRLINVICDRALLTGYVEEARVIKARHIQECAKELEIPSFAERSNTKDNNRQPLPSPSTGNPAVDGSEAHWNTEQDEIAIREIPCAAEDSDRNTTAGPKEQPPPHRGKSSRGIGAFATGAGLMALAALLYYGIWGPSDFSKNIRETVKNSTVMDTMHDLGRMIALDNPLQNDAAPPATSLNDTAEQMVPDTLLMPFPAAAALPPPEALADLDRLIQFLLSQPGVKAVVTGTNDAAADDTVNQSISRMQADSIKDYMINNGLPASRVEVEGPATESRPQPEDIPAAQPANHQVEVKLRPR